MKTERDMNRDMDLARTGILSRRAVLGGAAALLAATQARAQAGFPARPVKLIVPFPPGGGSDFIARGIQAPLGERLKQPLVIENLGGAGGSLGAGVAAKAAPDGYTVLMGSVASHAIAPAVYPKLPYDPLKDFVPVAAVGSMPHILVVHPSLGVNSLRELIALARAKPNEINFASAGNGSLSHLSIELIKLMAGVQMQHVPYKGSGPASADVASGHVKVLFESLAGGVGLARAGTVRPLGVSSPKRSPAMPDVPTLAESGLPGFEVLNWFGMFAPAGTPAAVVQRLSADISDTVALPAIARQFQANGAEPMNMSRDAFAAYVRDEQAKWAKVVRESGARIG